MTIINARWPRSLKPDSCRFGRSRNAVIQVSPRTRQETVILQGRPLWRAELTWRLPPSDELAKLRYWLDGIEGFAGSVQLWDFNNPYPLARRVSGELQWYGGDIPAHWDATGSQPTLTNSASIGDTQIDIEGLTPGQIAVVKGQYVQVGRRIYLVTADAEASIYGEARLSLSTGLLAAASAGDTVRLAEAACEMRLETQEWDSQSQFRAGLVTVTATFIETVTDYDDSETTETGEEGGTGTQWDFSAAENSGHVLTSGLA